MKEVALTRGLVAIVDDSDFDLVGQWKWSRWLGPEYSYIQPTHWMARPEPPIGLSLNRREQ